MTPESLLDTPYRLNPHVTSSIKSADSMAIFGAGAPLELPIDLFRVLMLFVENATVRQAFEALDVDVALEAFAHIIADFVERGLLRRDQPVDGEPGFRELLNPKIFSDPALVAELSSWMQQGRAIVIPDALPEQLAEQVYRDLDRSTHWRVAEGGHDFFHYRNCGLERLDDHSPALTECIRIFKSTATRRFIAELSGQDCSGETGVNASWYRPGEYALPHDDTAGNDLRSVAYIWYLTREWRQSWGGALYWCPTGQYLSPGFNVLAIFNVTLSNVHFVCPVAPTATAKRMALNGFWHRAERRTLAAPLRPDAVVSPPAYGARGPDIPAPASLLVL